MKSSACIATEDDASTCAHSEEEQADGTESEAEVPDCRKAKVDFVSYQLCSEHFSNAALLGCGR